MLYLSLPMELPALSQALRGSVALRDRFVVVRIEAGVLENAGHAEGLAHHLALLRALDARVIVVADAGPAAAVSTADLAAPFVAAIARHEQRALTLLPHGIVRMLPLVPFAIIDQAVLIQLCSLRYIPVLPLPVLDEAGKPVDVSATQIASGIAKFLEAVLVVHVTAGAATAPEQVEGEPRTIAVNAGALDVLFAELFLKPAAAKAES